MHLLSPVCVTLYNKNLNMTHTPLSDLHTHNHHPSCLTETSLPTKTGIVSDICNSLKNEVLPQEEVK